MVFSTSVQHLSLHVPSENLMYDLVALVALGLVMGQLLLSRVVNRGGKWD